MNGQGRMQITFVRAARFRYSTQVVRSDGVMVRVPSYDRKSRLPHDLAHYVVERELGLKHGFWGCVAQGAMFPGMEVVSGRRRPHATERAKMVIRTAGQRLIEAEVLVALMVDITSRGLEKNWDAVKSLIDRAWSPAKGAREPVGRNEVVQVCDELRKAEQQWQGMAPGEGLTVYWPGQHN